MTDYERMTQKELRGSNMYGEYGILGTAPSMHTLFSEIRVAAKNPNSLTVLLTGETGTGKELVAATIHSESPRKNNPYVKLDVGALSETLFEAELFGHKKGSFTGAVYDKVGFIKTAENGTIFLDEIGNTSLLSQASLLRFCEQGEYSVVGDSTIHSADVRIIAATSSNIKDKVNRNEFKVDLFYRLSKIAINVPSLRERKEDIPLLAYYFLAGERNNNMNGRQELRFSPDALAKLQYYTWPGNVRELENVVTQAVNIKLVEQDYSDSYQSSSQPAGSDQLVTEAHIEKAITVSSLETNQPGIPINTFNLALIEENMVRYVLAKCGGKKDKAASLLGITRKTIDNKLKRYSRE